MLAKNDIFEAVQTLNYCIDMSSDGKCDLLAEIVEYMSCDELNTMLNDICNTWFNCSLSKLIQLWTLLISLRKWDILLNSHYLELVLIIVVFGCVGYLKGYFYVKMKEYEREQKALLKWQVELENKASNNRKK